MTPALDDMTMDAIMRQWPATIHVVIRHRMLCVGCPVAPFHTLADAAREHDLDLGMLRRDLAATIAEHGANEAPRAPRQA